MQFRVNSVTQCTGGNHRVFTMTIDGASYAITVDRNDLVAENPDRGDREAAIVGRLVSALKEAGVGMSLPSWRVALEGKDYKI